MTEVPRWHVVVVIVVGLWLTFQYFVRSLVLSVFTVACLLMRFVAVFTYLRVVQCLFL